MKITKHLIAAIAAAVAAPALAVPLAAPAMAREDGGCSYADHYYTVSGKSIEMRYPGVPIFKDGKGGTLTVSRTYSSTLNYSVTLGAESEVGAVLAKAKVSISGTLGRTTGKTTTHTYSHKISSNRYGHAKYVNWGKQVKWVKKRRWSNCDTKVLAHGTIDFPSTDTEGWVYWETKS